MWDVRRRKQVDVFLDRAQLCHQLDFRDRLPLGAGPALPISDLLLMKLQIFETNAKDYTDIIALCVDNDFGAGPDAIDLDYLAGLTSDDWGLWRTTTMVAERVRAVVRDLADFDRKDLVDSRLAAYVAQLNAAPKCRRQR